MRSKGERRQPRKARKEAPDKPLLDSRITAAEVQDRWMRGDQQLAEKRRDYWLNRAFHEGHQWITWDEHRNTVETVPYDDDSDRFRGVFNLIRPRTSNLMGRLLKRDLAFESIPSGTSDDVVSAAKLGEFILHSDAVEQDWETIRSMAVFDALMGGTSAVCTEWRPKEGGELVTDPETGQTTFHGKSRLTNLSIAEFCLEPGTRTPRDARWWIRSVALPPEQVKEQYGLKSVPAADATSAYSPMHRQMISGVGGPLVELSTVLVCYQRPSSKGADDGFVATVVGNELVEVGDWPYESDELNLRVFRCVLVPGVWFGDTFYNSARSIQVAYNHVMSNLLEHVKLAGNARLMVPIGSLESDQELTDTPGEIIKFYPEAGAKPEYMAPPQIPRWIQNTAETLLSAMDDTLHTHSTNRGQQIGDRNSGLALSLLAEKDDGPLGLMSREQARGWGDIGSMVLEMYEQFATEERESVIPDDETGISSVRKWRGSDLRGQTRVIVPLDNTLPHSKVATQAMLVSMKQAFPEAFASISPAALARLIELPSPRMLTAAMDDEAACAQYENRLMAQGEVAVPDTWHDHAKHIAEHNRERNQPDFRAYRDQPANEVDPQTGKQLTRADVFDLHVKAHQEMAKEEAIAQGRLNQALPGIAGTPQADHPVGSMVPPPMAMRGMTPQGEQ